MVSTMADPNVAEGSTEPNASPTQTQESGEERTFVPPTDGSWVPRSRLDHEVGRRKEAEERLQSQPQPQTQVAPQEQTFTVQQLQGFVENGNLTETEAQAILANQQRRDLTREITSTVREGLVAEQRAQVVGDTYDEYVAAVPDLLTEGSDANIRLQRQVRSLEAVGLPRGRPTEVAAMAAVFGPAKTLPARGQRVLETHQETGGGGDTSTTSNAPEGLKLSTGQRAYYTDLISKGIYTGWDQVKTELKGYTRVAPSR